jgi:rRNA small subunit pseudouridine methyltransferase Nep1
VKVANLPSPDGNDDARPPADLQAPSANTAGVLTLVLADAELEPVPPKLAGHPAVRASARKRGRSPAAILLDSSLHHSALRNFPNGERRGRPDIVHLFVLLCLDSVVNLEGGLTTIVHTRNDEVLRFRPDTRVPKNYSRFVGLMEDLFQRGHVPDEESLITLQGGVSLETLLSDLPGESWAFAESGEPIDLPREFAKVRGDLVGVVGGFPHGTFRSPVEKLCDRVVSIHSAALRSWTVTAEALVAWHHRGPRRAPQNKASG